MAKTNADLLPIIPRIFFVYLEPIAISYGIYSITQQGQAVQAASAASSAPLGVAGLVAPSMACQHLFTVMVYGLLVLLVAPPSRSLVRLHVAVLAFADFTHWYGLFSAVAAAAEARGGGGGWTAAALDSASWDPETRELALYPFITLSVKFATLAGLFGRIGDA